MPKEKPMDADSGAQKLPKLLTEAEAARILRVSAKTLTSWRSSGRYPLAYVKIGGRVVYESDALRSFIENRTVMQRAKPR